MMLRGMSVCLFLLTVTMLAGCAESDPSRKGGRDAGAGSPKPAPVVDKKPTFSKGGKAGKAKEGDAPSSEKEGTPIEAATDLTRLEHKGFVIFYKGFSEEQMTAYLAHLYQFYTTGKEPNRTYGVFYYQPKLAKQNKGMRIVREGGFTKILFPVEKKMKDEKGYFGNIAVPLCHSLIKIDPTVKGNVAYATCDEDCRVIYKATEKFNR